MRVILAVVAVAAALLVAGGQLAEARADALLTRAVTTRGGSVGEVDVDLEGTPLLYHLLAGRVPAVRVTATELQLGASPITLDHVQLELRDVAVGARDLLDGPPLTLRPRQGRVVARIPAAQLARVVARERPGFDLQFGTGEISATGTVGGAEVSLDVALEVVDGDLTLNARRMRLTPVAAASVIEVARAFAVRVPLPELPGRWRFQSAEVTPDALVVVADAPARLVFR